MNVGTSLGAKAMAIPEFARWRRSGWQGRLGMVRYAAAPRLSPYSVATWWRQAGFLHLVDNKNKAPSKLIKVRN